MSENQVNSDVTGEVRIPAPNMPEGTITTSIPGAVTQQIGSGEHAQNSIVYRTILWSFIGGGALSAASILLALTKGSTNALGDVKDVWSIFAPLIALALGYLFGKGR